MCVVVELRVGFALQPVAVPLELVLLPAVLLFVPVCVVGVLQLLYGACV